MEESYGKNNTLRVPAIATFEFFLFEKKLFQMIYVYHGIYFGTEKEENYAHITVYFQ